jgi:multiple sugar transport system permease protein
MSRRVLPRRGIVEALNASFRHWSLLPAVLVFALLTAYPIVNLLRMAVSTVEFKDGREIWSFTPLRNWGLLLADSALGPVLFNTIVFVVAAVAIEMVAGLALALLIGNLTRGKAVLRTLMIIPILVPPVAIGSMFKLMFNHDFGFFNQLLAVIFLILFAAVEGLPKEVLEAARVDGATRGQLLRRVTLPLLMPALTVALVFRSILAFKTFDEVYLLTGGGPGTSSELLSLHLYKVFFEQNQLGYGALLSLAVIAAIVAFLLVARRVSTAVQAR